MARLLASVRRFALALPVLILSLLSYAPAHADAPSDPNGFRFEASALSEHENAGQAVITVEEIPCNPLNRGLGPVPTSNIGVANVDAFAWIANPGKSGGRCRAGAPKTGNFWLALALELVRHADYRVS